MLTTDILFMSNNSQFIMTPELAMTTLKKYLKDIKPKSQKTIRASFNSCIRLGIIPNFDQPNVVFEIVENATYIKNKEKGPQKYSQEGKTNLTKTLSGIARHLTDDEKIKVVKELYKKGFNANDKKKLLRHKPLQFLNWFKVNIEDEYAGFNGGSNIENKEKKATQKMNKKQSASYQEHSVFVEKIIAAMDELDIQTSHDIYQYQFLVAALIYLLADRNRRLDISDTRLEDARVTLRDDGIFIKDVNKNTEEDVLLTVTDPRLKERLGKLVEWRKGRNQTRLFLKENGDESKDADWFATAFKRQMRIMKIGHNLTMGVFRLSYGIMLSKKHDGSLVSEKFIEDAMGHCWSTHQHSYALNILEDGEGEEVPMEDVEMEED